MKKSLWKKSIGRMLLAAALLLTGCGGNRAGAAEAEAASAASPEDYFVWEGNIIKGLTDSGKEQKKIVIPARCEGMEELPFHETAVEEVSFESDRDIPLNGALSISGLKVIRLPAELSVIGSHEFWLCAKLETITVPGSVKSIGDFAFCQCESLKEVIFEEGELESIGEYVFDLSNALEKAKLPDSLKEIGQGAFEGKAGLTELTLPKNIRKIEGRAFLNTGITDVYIPEEVELEEIRELSFGVLGQELTAHVKKGSWCDEHYDEYLAPIFDRKAYD